MRRRYPTLGGAIGTHRVNGHEARLVRGHGGNPFGMSSEFDPHHVHLHGHDLAYRRSRDGEAPLLIHGMAGSSRAWRAGMPPLARQDDGIPPGFPRPGDAAPPARGDPPRHPPAPPPA